MLSLKSETPANWAKMIEDNVDEALLDHAHCEKKAAGTAVNLIFAHVEDEALALDLSAIAREELEHFELVIGLLRSRGVALRRLKPSSYGQRLGELSRKSSPEKIVDRMLIAALIEARSCERFCVLRDHLEDKSLAEFFGSFYESEARHYATYVKIAQRYGEAADVNARLTELAELEAKIVANSDGLPRIHS